MEINDEYVKKAMDAYNDLDGGITLFPGAMRAALETVFNDVRVKQLDWDGNVADAITGSYWIVNATKKWLYREPSVRISAFDSIEEAKVAAQADYEARIRSAIE